MGKFQDEDQSQIKGKITIITQGDVWKLFINITYFHFDLSFGQFLIKMDSEKGKTSKKPSDGFNPKWILDILRITYNPRNATEDGKVIN